jgi:hypothetical protein
MAKRVTAPKILLLLSDGKPRSSREIRKEIGLSRDAIGSSLIRLWKNGSILRTKEPNLSKNKIFRGRAGKTSNLGFFIYTFFVLAILIFSVFKVRLLCLIAKNMPIDEAASTAKANR